MKQELATTIFVTRGSAAALLPLRLVATWDGEDWALGEIETRGCGVTAIDIALADERGHPFEQMRDGKWWDEPLLTPQEIYVAYKGFRDAACDDMLAGILEGHECDARRQAFAERQRA